MTPSPVEELALAYVEHQPELAALMRAQHAKGLEHYGQSISEWKAKVPERAHETNAEGCDFITYLLALDPDEFLLDCHRIAYIMQRVLRYRDRQESDPMRSVRRDT